MAINAVFKKTVTLMIGFGSLFFLFQNCSPMQFSATESSSLLPQPQSLCDSNPQLPECSQDRIGLVCYFDGRAYPEGSVVKAFISSSASASSSCVSENRVCENGNFTGSYQYASCEVNAPESCLFDGRTIPHGQGVPAYLQSSVPFGGTCESENRFCNHGALSGSYVFSSCQVGAPQSCLFNGITVAHGATVKAYVNSTAAHGSVCEEQTRTCANGVLSGNAAYASCSVNTPASCLFNGQTISHGGTVKAYKNTNVAFGQSCEAEVRVCSNGSLSGSFTYGSCNVGMPKACLFNGQTIAHGQSVTGYAASSVVAGTSCVAQTRTCMDGALSGSYANSSCVVQANANCTFNNQTIVHGQQVIAYASSSVAYGSSCASQARVCNNGTLSGSYSYGSCSVGAARSCLFDGRTVAHGEKVLAYSSSSVAFGSTCSSQYRTCENGTLSGSYSYSSCGVQSAKTCNFNGQTVAHGSSVKAYAASTVSYGQSCQSQTRTCNNGVLSGSYSVASCSVNGPASCVYNGGTESWGGLCSVNIPATTIQHGGSRTFNSTSFNGTGTLTVACNNGAFSVPGSTCAEKRCEVLVAPAKCRLETYCENGRMLSRVDTQIPTRLAISGSINQVVTSQFSNVTLVEGGLTLTQWDPLSFRCDPAGWTQVNDGWCRVRKVVPNSTQGCAIMNNYEGGG